MNDWTLCVTAASGVEAVTKKELFRLGYGNVPAVNGAMEFKGDADDVARLNMFLRTADRVYIKLAEFSAETFDELFDGVYLAPWGDFLPEDAKIIVNGKSVKSKLFALSACQSVVKKAIIKSLADYYGKNNFDESGADYNVEFRIFKDRVSLLLNTSGAGLHKRGYRDYVGRAPIRETLAAAMLLLSDFYGSRPLRDPFCGSGTIIIEAARISLRIASGIQRKFDFCEWEFFDKGAYRRAYEEAKDLQRDIPLDFAGTDIDPKAIKLAERHARNAGLNKKVRFAVKDVLDFAPEKPNGVIVTNPPYGERLLEVKEAEALYKTLGSIYRGLDNWSLFIITNDPVFEKCFGKKADTDRKLYNANKECKYYGYYSNKEKR